MGGVRGHGQRQKYFVIGIGQSWSPSEEDILAGMCAARVHRGGKIRPNDLYDFMHAAAGIPSAKAYFCDNPMAHLLHSKSLQLEQHFPVLIRSEPEDLLDYLQNLMLPIGQEL